MNHNLFSCQQKMFSAALFAVLGSFFTTTSLAQMTVPIGTTPNTLQNALSTPPIIQPASGSTTPPIVQGGRSSNQESTRSADVNEKFNVPNGKFNVPTGPTPSRRGPQPPIVPANPASQSGPQNNQTNKNQNDLNSDARKELLFGAIDQVDGLSAKRRPLALSPGANATFSAEARGRKTSDIGHLLQESKSTQGISIQRRTPIINDTRIRGQRTGQVLASGSYWGPARMDLDTMMSKIDSRLIDDAILVKGPYAARYGPGFRFVDLDLKRSPRFQNGFQTQGSTSLTYNTNGQRFYGRQTVEGGSDDFGFLFSYGHQTGNDFETGLNDFSIPSSFKSRDVFGVIGKDISPYESLELHILRLDQTDLEFPGTVFDLNFLVTDGYELTYRNSAPLFADQFEAEIWYNRTRFEGDTFRDGKRRQIPSLQFSLDSVSGFDGGAITDGDALSGGYRLISSFDIGQGQLALGTDLNLINQELNDIEPTRPMDRNNFPIPAKHEC